MAIVSFSLGMGRHLILHLECSITPTRRHQNLQPAPEDAGGQELPADEKVDSFLSTSPEPQAGHSG